MARRNRKEATEDPETVHVWLARIKGSTTGYAVRARFETAKAWTEHLAGAPEAEWRAAESGIQHYVKDDGTVKGILEPVELPEVAALFIEGG